MKPTLRGTGAALGYLGATISLVAYVGYAIYLLGGSADTNVVTWILWSVEAVLGFRIYKSQTRGDLAKYAEEVVAALGCCAISAMLLLRALFAGADILGPLAWVDGVSALLFVIVFWIYRRSLKADNVWPATLAFQAALIFSAFPLVRTALENPAGEPLLPWLGWAIGFALQLSCAFLRRDRTQGYWEIPTPLNYLFWHALVAGIIYLNAA